MISQNLKIIASIIRSRSFSQLKHIERITTPSITRMASTFNYPVARREEIKETFFGKEVNLDDDKLNKR